MGTNATAYQKLTPCVDEKGHRFAVSNPEPGQWGYSIVYCTRCGGTREELAKLKEIVADAVDKALKKRNAESKAPTD